MNNIYEEINRSLKHVWKFIIRKWGNEIKIKIIKWINKGFKKWIRDVIIENIRILR